MFTFVGKVPSPKASINEATSKATKIHSTEECTRHITCDEIMKLRHNEAICPANSANSANCIQAAAITENLKSSLVRSVMRSFLPFPTSPFWFAHSSPQQTARQYVTLFAPGQGTKEHPLQGSVEGHSTAIHPKGPT